MKLLLKRIFTNNSYTIGHLYIVGENDMTYICDVLEDSDLKEFDNNQSTSWILNNKSFGRNCIPTGEYEIAMNIVSPKFSQKAYYKKVCNGGKLPRLLNVPAYEGVLIHTGNTASDTNGCLLTGYNKVKGKVLESKKAFEKLYKILDEANKRGEIITIDIQRHWKRI